MPGKARYSDSVAGCIPQRVTEEREALPHRQLCEHDRKFSLDHEEPELQIKKEKTELGTDQEEALVLKQEADTMTPVYEGSEHNYSEPNHSQLLSHRSASLIQRRTTVSADEGPPDTCKTCGKRFSSSAMKRHMKTHAAGKPFSCKVCQKSFSQSSRLAAHVRRHTGEKPHSCKDCGKRFPQKSALTVHTRTHTGEKPHGCEECGTSFAQKCALVAHTRTHTGEKPYRCKVCQRSFRQSSSLADHVRTHAGGKGVLIIAKNVERSFTHKVALTVHQSSDRSEATFLKSVEKASSRGGI
ncbi:zinc finger protein 436-like [Melanotaenia boesemani]|uniref:zinc finger protein 436-like n=1 Tax=Melanotaenia boesemani TaxID=1250792 RepID=UPI001C051905|nr:zinc finger protein 436-like [Melanotaenia boesemani]